MKRCICLPKTAVGLLLILAGPLQALDYYVAQEGQTPDTNSPPTYASWDNAASNIQEAVDVAVEGDTVWIRPGRYIASASPTNFAGFNNVVYMDNKLVSLRATTNDVPGSRALIDGEGVNRGIAVDRTSSTSAALLLEGLTISNCVLSASVGTNAYGAGIHLAVPSSGSAWDATLRDCVITHNRVDGQHANVNTSGGGLWCTSRSALNLTVSNSVFSNNSATNLLGSGWQYGSFGGAAYLSSGGDIVFSDSVFERNNATEQGGAVVLGGVARKNLIRNCIFRDNQVDRYNNAGSGGGGVRGSAIFRNCLFVGNKAAPGSRGGAIAANLNAPEFYVESCTIISNSSNTGGGIYSRSASGVLNITNSIIYHNESTDILHGAPVTNYISYSCIGTMTGVSYVGSNNIAAAPGFVDWTAQDYRLRADSPCVNAGANLDWMAGARDLDGNRRINRGRVDLGAYERQVKGSLLLLR